MQTRAKGAGSESDRCAAARHVRGKQDVALEGYEISRVSAHDNCP
jgi:hypothetical protein